MRFVCFLIVYLFITRLVVAQQPAFFMLGEEQFKGIQIYDVIQDNNQNFWFATNEGVYKFDYYKFEKIDCSEAKGNSMFKFVMNAEGTIYCHNLNNQIFQIKNSECRLFYELSPEEAFSDISLMIGDDNNLIIGAKAIIVLDYAGNRIGHYSVSKKYLGPGYQTKNKHVLFHISGSDFVISYSKGKFTENKLQYKQNLLGNGATLCFFTLKNTMFACDLVSKVAFKYHPQSFKLSPLPKNTLFEKGTTTRIYETNNELWVAGTKQGVGLIKDTLSLSDSTMFYKDYFISDVFRDKEGNILLSTFDKGILVIQDLKIPDVINSFRDEPITSLHIDHEIGLLLGSTKGRLINYARNEFKQINNVCKRPINGIYSSPISKYILYDDGLIQAYNKQTKQIKKVAESSLKDAIFTSKDQFYIGTNIGIAKCSEINKSKFNVEWISNLHFRIYSLAYDSLKGILYAASANGLISINGNKVKKVLYNGKSIFSKTLYFHGHKLYIPTSKSGILVLENDSIKTNILPVFSNKTEEINKLIIHQNNIISKSSNNFFKFSMNGNFLQSIPSTFGFSSHRVIDFDLQQNILWVSHSGGVQQIDLTYKKTLKSELKLRLNKILVNDHPPNLKAKESFKSDERKIEFTLSAPTLRNRENISYHYQLLGYDTKWNINSYQSNIVTYNALAPGSYTFIAKIQSEDDFSNSIEYTFTIAEPFYNRWWFLLCVLSLFILSVLFVYNRQLKIQQKKSQRINELNASKLTAIQSQMNPHFIFNALNSIQDFVLKGDIENSYSYITTFSNLVRRTLNYSDKEFVDFEQEIKLIELYLSLESLRFKKDFSYKIDTNQITDIQIPPMLIQPFIENALAHGLLHKSGQKVLTISFVLKEELICTIEDNGIGREKAKTIKLRQRPEHESFSLKAIEQRFEILKNTFGGALGYTYMDINNNNIATGTRVNIKIPVKHKF